MLTKFNATVGLSKVIIMDKNNSGTSLHYCKGPPSLEEVGNPDSDSILEINNSFSKTKSNCVTEMEELNDGDKVSY